MNSWSIENETDTTSYIDSKIAIEKLKDILLEEQDNDNDITYIDDEEDDEEEEDIDEEDYEEEEEEEIDYEEEYNSKLSSSTTSLSNEEEEEEEEMLPISSPTLSPTTSSTTTTPDMVLSKLSTSDEIELSPSITRKPQTKPTNINEPAYLEYEWVFYYDDSTLKGQNSDDYQSYIKNLGSFNTVQGFWEYWNNIINSSMFPDGANLRLFKQGIAPMWEDPCNANGGKWTLSCYKEQSHNLALKSLLALIGDQLDHSYDICGFVLSVRSSRHVISVWNKSGDNKEIHDRTAEQLKDCVFGKVFKYYPHKQLSGSVPQSPMTPSVSSNNLSSYINGNNSNSTPTISSNGNNRLTNSCSISNDLYKEAGSNNSTNNNCNSNNNLISSFENENSDQKEKKETFKHKKSQSTSSIYGNSSLINSNSNCNTTPSKPTSNSNYKLRKENSKSNIIVSSTEISRDNNENINNSNSTILTNTERVEDQQQHQSTKGSLLKSSSKDDLKNKKQQQQQQTPQKKLYNKPPLKDRNPTPVPVTLQKEETIIVATNTLVVEKVEEIIIVEKVEVPTAVPSILVNEELEVVSSDIECNLFNSNEEKIIDSPNDEGSEPFTNDESVIENASEISDFHTDESSSISYNNQKSKKKKSKSKNNNSNNTNNNSKTTAKSPSTTTITKAQTNNRKNSLTPSKGNLNNHKQHQNQRVSHNSQNNSYIGNDNDIQNLVSQKASLLQSPTFKFCKEHFLVFLMIFSIISMTIILQK